MTVLITGGAGYIGSHMVYAMVAAGEKPVVLDHLSTGFDWAIAEGVPLVMGETGDQALVSNLLGEHRTGQSTKGATHLIKVAVETALGRRPEMDVFGTD